MPVTRRGFLLMVTSSAAVAIGRRAGGVVWPGGARGDLTLRAHLLAQCVRQKGSSRALGRAYLAASASPPALDALVASLWPSRLGPAASVPALRAALAARSRADFAAGRTVSVDGWLLSQSESRLFALTALLAAS